MTVAVVIAAICLVLGAGFATIRLVKGPGPIDRAAALDVLLAIVVAAVVVIAAVTQSASTLAVAVVVSLLGFVGSSGLALFLGRDRP